MSMHRKIAIQEYMVALIRQYDLLTAERQLLLNPETRLAEIQAERQNLIADAQEILAKYNAVHGTNYTLQQVRDLLAPPPPTPTP